MRASHGGVTTRLHRGKERRGGDGEEWKVAACLVVADMPASVPQLFRHRLIEVEDRLGLSGIEPRCLIQWPPQPVQMSCNTPETRAIRTA